MAETRKHREEVRDELDRALRAALGKAERPTAVTDETDEPQHAASSFIAPGSAIAGFTFGQPPARSNG